MYVTDVKKKEISGREYMAFPFAETSVDPKTKRDFEQREAKKWERANGTLPSSSTKTKTKTTTATLAGRQEQRSNNPV